MEMPIWARIKFTEKCLERMKQRQEDINKMKAKSSR
jgi:hypothetical protein